MRYVLYDDESLEPITVLDLPLTERDALNCNVWRIPVREPVSATWDWEPPSTLQQMKVVDVWFETFVRKGKKSVMCFTRATEMALLLDPAWLPGQRSAIDLLRTENARLSHMLLALMTHD